ncbi:MAG: maleylacetoacetate isomerase [Pseudomonadota bacterium]
MEFYGYFRSSCAYRCRIALNLKDVPHSFHSVHLRRNGGEHKSEAFLRVNPQGLVPALRDGALLLNQSLAIIEWLDETQPGLAFLPPDPAAKAQVRAFAQMIACDIHPLQNLRVLQYLGNEFDADQSAKDAWCQQWIGDGLAACESVLARQKDPSEFCFGNAPGLADICLVPQMFSAARFGVDTSKMPRLNAVYSACQNLPAFADAAPSKQPDSET